MSPRLSREEWDRRADVAGLEWTDGRPLRSDTPHPARCLTCGHEWSPVPNNVSRGGGCPLCARSASRVTPEEWNRRASSAGLEWVGATPRGAHTKTPVRCLACGREWEGEPSQIAGGKGCRDCGIRRRTKGLTLTREVWDERAVHVGIRWLADPENSKAPTAAECLTCGHQFTPAPSNVNQGSGCPRCARQRTGGGHPVVTPEEWARRAAAIGIEWVCVTPTRSTSRTPVRCLTCGHEWDVWPGALTKGAGCPVCARNAPVGQSEWDRRAAVVGVEWLAPVGGKDDKRPARCLMCGYEWQPRPGVIGRGGGCPVCRKAKASQSRRVTPEEWDRRAARLGLEWKTSPTNNFERRPAGCLTCGHEWSPIPATVASGSGCPVCSGNAVAGGGWAARAAEVGIEWLIPPPSARGHAPARCLTCGHEWSVAAMSVARGSGCPVCAVYGIDPSRPGRVYLIVIPDEGLMKVGVQNTDGKSDRLAIHQRRGWSVVGSWDVPTAADALAVETAVLREWRQRGARFATSEEVPAGDGFSETIHAGSVPVDDAMALIRGLLEGD
jgi:predicted Zn-ribbon and HTH transcriptional regulator